MYTIYTKENLFFQQKGKNKAQVEKEKGPAEQNWGSTEQTVLMDMRKRQKEWIRQRNIQKCITDQHETWGNDQPEDSIMTQRIQSKS